MTQVTGAPPEPVRLAAVRRTSLLDTPPEEAFDRLTRLAANLLGTPVSLLSLVEENRQFFKSATGLPEPLATSRVTPLSYSFCRHVVASGARLVVEDAWTHPLVRTNPAIRELGWVSYAGVPLTDRDGNVLGALSVIDSRARLWSEQDLDLLSDLAAWAVTEIELRALGAARGSPSAPQGAPAYSVFEEISVPMAVVSDAGRLLQVNRAFGALVGADPDSLAGRLVEELTHPADREADREALRLLGAKECGSYTTEKRVLKDSAEPVWVQATVTRVAAPGDGADHFIVALNDLTERKRIEASLREREERYRLVTESGRDIVLDWDLLTDRLEWSNAPDGMFGYALSEFGADAGWWYEHLHPDDRERVVGEIHGVAARGEGRWISEHRFRRADGEWAHVEARASIVRDDAGDAVRMVGSFMDLTERKDEELRQARKKEAMEQLAGGIAHDFNSLLTGILGLRDLVGKEVPQPDPIPVTEPEVLSVNVVLAGISETLRRLLGVVALEITPDPALWHVMSDPGELEQMIVGLVTHARDTLPEGGRVAITTANCRVRSEGPQRAAGVTPGAYVMLKVTASGLGVDAPTRTRLFEPVLPARDEGTGAGPRPGLKHIYGIVEKSGGHIMENAPGRGPMFTVYLPRHDEPRGASPSA
jgi:PAS domain S-box-containing protein